MTSTRFHPGFAIACIAASFFINSETDSPGGGHIEGLTLRLFDPDSHEWRLYWANSKDGVLVVPQIGVFKNGVGEFYAQDTGKGKSVFVRFIWTNTTQTSRTLSNRFQAMAARLGK